MTQSEYKKQKQELKAAVMEFEKNNHTHLVFFASNNNYYKMAGNSVLIYAGNIARRIGRRYNLQIDTDHYSVSEVGVISFRLTKDLDEKLNSIHIVKDEEKTTKQTVYYKLEKAVTDDELSHFRDVVEAEEKKINQIVLPKSPVPVLYEYVRELNLIIFQSANTMPAFARMTIGAELFTISDKILQRYIEYAHTQIEEVQALKLMNNGVKLIKYKMKNVEELRILPRHTICRILEQVINIEKLTNKLYQQAKNKPDVQK